MATKVIIMVLGKKSQKKSDRPKKFLPHMCKVSYISSCTWLVSTIHVFDRNSESIFLINKCL